MKPYELTGEELKRCGIDYKMGWQEGQKKLLEWGKESCINARHYQHGVPIFPRTRFDCPKCIEPLLKDFEL